VAGPSVSARNQALNGLDASGTPVNLMAYTNLNTTDPGTTGAAEATSARQASAWNASSGGSKTNSGAMTFTGQSSTTAHGFFSTWTALTAGTNGMNGTLTTPVTAATITVAAGALTINA
jgi:hypothetical protein